MAMPVASLSSERGGGTPVPPSLERNRQIPENVDKNQPVIEARRFRIELIMFVGFFFSFFKTLDSTHI